MITNLKKVISKIKDLEKFKLGWHDRTYGVPASKKTITDAIIFSKNLNFDFIHLPHISLAEDGEINFWWDLERIKMGLGFYGDGTYSYYAWILETGEEFYGEDESVSHSFLPLRVLDKLKNNYVL